MPTFDASTDRLLRTSGVLDHNSAYTVMCWIWPSSIGRAVYLRGVGRHVFGERRGAVHLGQSGQPAHALRGQRWHRWVWQPNGSVLSANTWYHVAIVRESTTSLKSYLNGVYEQTCTVSAASRSASSRMEFGAWSTGKQ